MKLHRRQFLHLSGAALAGIAMRPTAWAQGYPERAVRVIVPYAPGGPTDIIARLVALKLSDRVGKQFYVENIAGAGGNIGMGRAAQATPDGYTVLFVASPYVINPTLYEKVPFDHKDFDPVTLAVNSAIVLTVPPSMPANPLKALVALLTATPRKYNATCTILGTP